MAGPRTRVPSAAAFGVVAVGLSLGACKGAEAGPPAGGAKPVPVIAAQVVQKDVPVEVRTVGSAEAVATVEVVPQVGGLVQQVGFKEGDFVKKGDLLFTIDTRPYQATLSAAQAELAKNRALAEGAHRDLERAEKLAAEGLVTDLELTAKRANAAALDATLGANRASITGSSINVQFATIRSPIDGRTGALLVQAGNVVKTTEARPMVVIRTLEPIYARFSVPEQFLPRIREEQAKGPIPVRAKPRGAEGEGAKGELSFIENSVDPATGKIDMKAVFRNEGQVLWPGQFLEVILDLSIERGAIVVPESAVQTGQQGPYTFVIGADMKVALRHLDVKRVTAGEVVVTKGVAPGERVVTDGQVRLRDGAAVTLKTGPGAPSASAAR